MHSRKYSQSNCKTICVWFSQCCAHKSSEAVHQANRSMEKDCLVNEVWSGATEGCVCHQIYSAAALWFPAAVKQWGGDWSKLHCSCQPPDCLQPFDGVSLLQTNCLSPVPLLTHKYSNSSPNLPHSLYLCLMFCLPLAFFKCQDTTQVHDQQVAQWLGGWSSSSLSFPALAPLSPQQWCKDQHLTKSTFYIQTHMDTWKRTNLSLSRVQRCFLQHAQVKAKQHQTLTVKNVWAETRKVFYSNSVGKDKHQNECLLWDFKKLRWTF